MQTETYKNLFGPSLSYFTSEYKSLSEKQQNNIDCIVNTASSLIVTYRSKGIGINSRVVGDLMRQGAFAENSLFLKYLAGISVSSHTDEMQSDQGSYYINFLQQISSYQVTIHKLIYAKLRKIFADTKTERSNWQTTISIAEVLQQLQIKPDKSYRGLIKHIFKGLQRLVLIREAKFAQDFMQQGVQIRASGIGVELYLWAQGRGDLSRDSLKYLIDTSVLLENF
ncbi:MAG: hypothetical protein AAF518_24205 [Spirochaetota bacterium]